MGIVSEWVLMFSKGLVLEVYIYLGTCTNIVFVHIWVLRPRDFFGLHIWVFVFDGLFKSFDSILRQGVMVGYPNLATHTTIFAIKF